MDIQEVGGGRGVAVNCGGDPSGSVQCGEFTDWLRNCQILKKGSFPWSSIWLRGVGCSILCL